MMIIMLILATFVFAGAMIFGHTGLQRTLTVIISFAVIAVSLAALVLNDNYHWGMHQVKTTQIQDLTPLKTTQAALGIRKLGTGSEQLVVYRLKDQTKPVTTTAATTTKIKTITGQPAQVQITTTRWQYQNHFTKVLFSLGKDQAPVINRQYLFTIPKNWRSVSVK